MKLTRKKLRQLIEAFISGPLGTKHIPDEDYPYSRLEKQLGGDPAMATAALALARGDKLSQEQFRNIESSFPIYDDEGNQIETDYIGDTRQMYHEYDLEAYEIFVSPIKEIALNVISNPQFLDYRPSRRNNAMKMTVFIDDRQAAEEFVMAIKQQGLGKHLTYMIK